MSTFHLQNFQFKRRNFKSALFLLYASIKDFLLAVGYQKPLKTFLRLAMLAMKRLQQLMSTSSAMHSRHEFHRVSRL